MRDKPEESTGAARLSPGGLPRSLSALAPVDACIRPRPALPRMRPYKYLIATNVPRRVIPLYKTVFGYECETATARGLGRTMEEAYEHWKQQQADYYWPVSP